MARVLVGLSGGVDSSVVAAILKDQGHEVLGYTLKLLEETSEDAEGCCTFKDIRDASQVCDKLGIEFLVTNWKKRFQQEVIDKYLQGIRAGINTNPCVTCNSSIKIPVLAAVANHFRCDYVATGHYARVNTPTGRIARAKNLDKDQSYFLWDVPQQIIPHLLFPLGEFASKDETRALAVKYGLGDAMTSKPDSTNLCFLGGGTKEEFLAKHGFQQTQGDFVDAETGAVVGKHTGYQKFVPGQRAGIPGLPSRKVVLSVLPTSNTVLVTEPGRVGMRELRMAVADTRMGYAGDVKDLMAVTRYRSSPAPVEAYNSITGVLRLGAEVVSSPGQSVVFYLGDEVVGGGVVTG